MPRRARIVLPGVPMHLIQRGNNRQACFYADEDCLFYLEHKPWSVPFSSRSADDLVVLSSEKIMKSHVAVIERCPQTKLFAGFEAGFPGANAQGETLDELDRNLQEGIAMLLGDGEPELS